MKKGIIFTAIFFGVGLSIALIIENVISGTQFTMRNISAHLMAGLVGAIVFGVINGLMQKREKS